MEYLQRGAGAKWAKTSNPSMLLCFHPSFLPNTKARVKPSAIQEPQSRTVDCKCSGCGFGAVSLATPREAPDGGSFRGSWAKLGLTSSFAVLPGPKWCQGPQKRQERPSLSPKAHFSRVPPAATCLQDPKGVGIGEQAGSSYRDAPNWTTVCPKPAAFSLNMMGFSTSRLDPSQEARTKEYRE